MRTPGPRTYRYRIAFAAPRPFVFRWCTDYQPSDPALEGEAYSRKVVSRTPRRVVYEDLEDSPHGWSWARHVVTLRYPRHWHSDSVGNYRNYRLAYDLVELPGGRTELRFVGTRKASLLGTSHPTPAAFARSMDRAWHRFRRELEREYRAEGRADRGVGRKTGRRSA